MKTKIQEKDGKVIVYLDGEMDTAAAVEVEANLKSFYKNEGKDIVIECEKLQYIASSGLRILLSILKGAKAAGNTVTLRHLSDDIKNVFSLTGFINIFNIE